MQTTTATNRTPPPRSSGTIPRSRLTPQETSASEAPTLATTRTRQTAIRTEQLNLAVSTDQLPQSNVTWRITAMTPRTRSTAASSAVAPTSATTRTRQTAIRTEQLNPVMVSTEELPRSNATRRVTATTPRTRSTAASSAIPPTPPSAFGGMNATQPPFPGFPSATLRPTPSSASGVVDVTSSPSSQVPTQPPFTGCGWLLNSSRGTFASPGYPFSYSNNLNCLWTLRIPTDSVLSLQFERFNTDRCCDFVELTVSTGRLARLSGFRNGFSITVRGDRSPVLNITFTTDRSVVRPGFFARYIIIFGFPSATLRPTPSSASGVVDVTSSLSSQVPSQPPFTMPRPTSFTPFNNVTLPNTARPPSNTPFVTLPTEVRRKHFLDLSYGQIA
ncbi:Deleted in malignant brain tumors 1 protein [Stylophora pistillata]|uniref:Deleted in malignant brain tumors 1 protein n=1 Tax=Stylophora pistillata TaxID=50429 RepID=A0A2B4S032_STYPI|nr:Deleted in malignant brain tumors 1 protein [Stylophora pistillata]